MATFKPKVIDIIDDEVKKASNYQNINTKQSQQSNSQSALAKCTEVDQRTGTLTIKQGNKTFTGIQPGSAAVGPGSVGLFLGGVVFQGF